MLAFALATSLVWGPSDDLDLAYIIVTTLAILVPVATQVLRIVHLEGSEIILLVLKNLLEFAALFVTVLGSYLVDLGVLPRCLTV